MAKFPIRVVIWKKYASGLVPVIDRGMYKKERFKTEAGFIETNYFIFKKEKIGGKKLRIPAPDIQYYQSIEWEKGKTERQVMFLQIDRYTFWACTEQSGKIYVHVPQAIYEVERDAEGHLIRDENNNFKIKLDENKQPVPILDKDGKPAYNYIPKLIFDSDIVMDNDKITSIPAIMPHKTYDKEQHLSAQIEMDERLYRSKSFWEKYGSIIAMLVSGMIMVFMLSVALSNFAQYAQIFANSADKFLQGESALADSIRIQASACLGKVVTNITAPPF